MPRKVYKRGKEYLVEEVTGKDFSSPLYRLRVFRLDPMSLSSSSVGITGLLPLSVIEEIIEEASDKNIVGFKGEPSWVTLLGAIRSRKDTKGISPNLIIEVIPSPTEILSGYFTPPQKYPEYSDNFTLQDTPLISIKVSKGIDKSKEAGVLAHELGHWLQYKDKDKYMRLWEDKPILLELDAWRKAYNNLRKDVDVSTVRSLARRSLKGYLRQEAQYRTKTQEELEEIASIHEEAVFRSSELSEGG
jgi:hypothetical protein